MTTIGFIGLGLMGSRIAKRLLDAGYPVVGYNRTPAKATALVDVGMKLCTSPREVAQTADVTLSMVSDTAAVETITGGANGILAGLSDGKIYIDMSTVSPRVIRDLAKRTTATGARMLEAPVSGSIPAAEGGTLIAFVGGDAETLERARPILEVLSQKIIHMGENGQGIATKIAINMSLPIQLIALFEGVLLAERSGISRQDALDALLNSVMASPAMKYRAPFIFNMPKEVWFSVAMMEKDIQLALDMGEELGVPLATAQVCKEFLVKARQLGYRDEDFAALFKVLAQLSGLS